jgi:hypothetical protein
MPDYYFPYIPLMGPDGPMEEPDKFNTRYGWMHRVPLKLYYFICDGRVQAETTTLMVHEDKIDDDEYITKEAVLGNEQERVSAGKFKRTLDSNKILVHYTKSDRWFCLKDRESVQVIADGPRSHEMTSKEKTFLALTAEPV